MKILSLKILEILPELCQDVVFLQKTKEVMFMNRSVNYFAKTINLKKTNLNEVLDNPDLIPEFKTKSRQRGKIQHRRRNLIPYCECCRY
jgi:hypothetical protein